jgi:hypothetical protein
MQVLNSDTQVCYKTESHHALEADTKLLPELSIVSCMHTAALLLSSPTARGNLSAQQGKGLAGTGLPYTQ